MLILFRTLLHLITQEISLRFPTCSSSVKSQILTLSLGNRDTKMFYGSVTYQSEDRQKAEPGPLEHEVSEYRPPFSSSVHIAL